MTRGEALDVTVKIATGVLADQGQPFESSDHELVMKRLGMLLIKLLERDAHRSIADRTAEEAAAMLRDWT